MTIPPARLGRRALVAGGALAAATPAAAQFGPLDLSTIFSVGKNLVDGLNLGEADEMQMGKELYQPFIAESGGAYQNARVQNAMRSFAQPIFATSKRANFQWEITVVDDNTVNAWALPAGKIAINKGLLRYVDSESELAAVISHEMGHAELSHQLAQMKNKAFTSAATDAAKGVAMSAMRGPGGALTGIGLDVIRNPLHDMITSGYGRENEREADRHILSVFSATGFDPTGSTAFFRTLLQLVPPGQEGTTSLFSTHPGTMERIANLEAEIPRTPRPPSTPTSAAHFADIKTSFPTRKIYRRNA
jgi:predicted Zn-dependent protease